MTYELESLNFVFIVFCQKGQANETVEKPYFETERGDGD
jgi:hypothetical protein